MDITLREANHKDYEQIERIYFDGDTLHFSNITDIFQTPRHPARTKEAINEILSDSKAVMYIAESNDKILGIIHAFITEQKETPPMRQRTLVKIESILVSPEFQNQGIGQELMTKVEEWAEKKGIKEIELGVFGFNENAISFYEKTGYKT